MSPYRPEPPASRWVILPGDPPALCRELRRRQGDQPAPDDDPPPEPPREDPDA